MIVPTIEQIMRDYLGSVLDVPVYLEVPTQQPDDFVLLSKTGSGRRNYICTATLAVQSYGKTMLDAATLNERVKTAMDDAITLPRVSRSALNSDYNFTDTETRHYRYQAVYDIVHY